MSLHPLVSIIIPVYNGANYVGEAIQSALDQSYNNCEVVVVDDGSNDNGATRRVIETFGDRVRYIQKHNGGVATALNTGIEHMRGELFSWLSHDDAYLPDKITHQVETLTSFGRPCVVIGDYHTTDESGRLLHHFSSGGCNLIARPLDSVFRGLINGCTLLVPRDLFRRAGLFAPDLPSTQDYHLWYRMALLVPFVHCSYSDVQQRIHAQQGSRLMPHLDEASRMFAHILDSTPARLMEAYDGSELRFLLRTRHALTPYAGLQTYLARRIGELMKSLRYSAVLRQPADNRWLRTLPVPPCETLVCPNGNVANLVRLAVDNTNEDLVLFQTSHVPASAEITSALEALIVADADLVRSMDSDDSDASTLVVVRRDALPRLQRFVQLGAFNWNAIASELQVATCHSPAVPPADHQQTCGTVCAEPNPVDQLSSAWRGELRVNYDPEQSLYLSNIVAGLLMPQLPVILLLAHTAGGGVHTHVRSLAAALRGKAIPLVCYGSPDGEFRLSTTGEQTSNGVVFHLPEQLPDLVNVLRSARVMRADVHHVIGFEKYADALLDALNIPFDITLVDYYTVATNPFLCLDSGRFPGDQNLKGRDAALVRREPLPILWKAARIFAISRDLAARIQRLAPGLTVTPVKLWHENGVQMRHVFPPLVRRGEPLRVVISGDIGLHKGEAMVNDVAHLAAIRNLPLQFHVLGHLRLASHVRQEAASVLQVHGRFNPGGFVEALGRISPHVAWIPSQAPETWSYVLTDFMEAGLPVAAPATGAFPERCYERPWTWLLPWNATPENWIDLFLRLHASNLAEPPRWAPIDHLPAAADVYFEDYLHA